MTALLDRVHASGPLSNASWDVSAIEFLGRNSTVAMATIVCLDPSCESGLTVSGVPVPPGEPADPSVPGIPDPDVELP